MPAQPRHTSNSNIAILPASTSCPPCNNSFIFSTIRLQVSANNTLYFTSKNNDSTVHIHMDASLSPVYKAGAQAPETVRSSLNPLHQTNNQSNKEWEWVNHAITPSATINNTLPKMIVVIFSFQSSVSLSFPYVLSLHCSLFSHYYLSSSCFFFLVFIFFYFFNLNNYHYNTKIPPGIHQIGILCVVHNYVQTYNFNY